MRRLTPQGKISAGLAKGIVSKNLVESLRPFILILEYRMLHQSVDNPEDIRSSQLVLSALFFAIPSAASPLRRDKERRE